MIGHHHATSIGMAVDAVAPTHTLQGKPVGLQRTNKAASL
jgi:hypothetical protein